MQINQTAVYSRPLYGIMTEEKNKNLTK